MSFSDRLRAIQGNSRIIPGPFPDHACKGSSRIVPGSFPDHSGASRDHPWTIQGSSHNIPRSFPDHSNGLRGFSPDHLRTLQGSSRIIPASFPDHASVPRINPGPVPDHSMFFADHSRSISRAIHGIFPDLPRIILGPFKVSLDHSRTIP